MKSIKISAALATYNEETTILDCLKSLKQFADEIIVVDGKSSDSTPKLVLKAGARLISTENKKMFHINKNVAINACKNSWVFLIDADERVTKELALEIKKMVVSKPKENGFWVNRRNWFLGGFLTKGGAYPDGVIRLFKKGKGRLPEISVHEQVEIDGEVGYLKNDLIHLADPDFSRYLMRANRYTSETASLIAHENPGQSPATIIYYIFMKPLNTFFSIYFRHKGFADGFRGFAWALFSGAHYFFAYIKYWQTLNRQNADLD